jgi:hypothetical protein
VMTSTPGSACITLVSSDLHYWIPRLTEADSPHIADTPKNLKYASMAERYNRKF